MDTVPSDWSYKTGERGRNRVRAYVRPNRGFFLEFYVHDPDTGERKRRRRSLDTGDSAEAKAEADRLAAELADRSSVDPDEEITLRTLFDSYIERRGSRLSEDRRSYYEQMRELFCRYFGPWKRAMSLNRADWDRFVEDRLRGAIDGRGQPVTSSDERTSRSPNTAKKNLKALRAVMNWGVEADFLESNPTEGYPLPSDSNPPRPRVTQERYEALLEVASEVDWRFRLALVLAHETGHRIGAIRRLRWSDVNLREGLIRWRGEADKRDKTHVTPMTESAREALREAREEQPALGEAWVFPAPKDESQACSKSIMRGWWLKAEERADLKHIDGLGWHGLRRKFADEHRDVAPRDLADLGGWDTPRTILEVYQDADLDAMRDAQQRRRTLRESGRTGG